MSPKIFLTGATGFIGGDALYLIKQKHPDWQLTCLVRDEKKGAEISARFPDTNVVVGSIEDVPLVEDLAAKADIVIHTGDSSHNQVAAQAIGHGMARNPSGKRRYWLHTSGTGLLGYESREKNMYGEWNAKEYDDWDNLHEVISHHGAERMGYVDKIVLESGSDLVKTAIVAPAIVYGEGRGICSATRYPLLSGFLPLKKVFKVGKGENIIHYLHVQDLSELYLLLAEAAVEERDAELWNDKGYYIAENGSFVSREWLQLVANYGYQKELFTTAELESVTAEEAERLIPFGSVMYGFNSRSKGIRGKKLLGWEPKMPNFETEVGNLLVENS
ncbi:NAD(P)-binding protein [Corynespora cassiicola Philippines]|uniref:NAD(P)-binding protein n=1 Tax=Corynespora cassiicola Philippines TaxID=1448308 RepID=A0A2T2NZG6_CORCC|nr:NAD(P)-binding protein [Corynespora cassiicola Philippines]